MRRHFTATGFVVQGDRTLLLWHKRLQAWVPPGGHIDADEDPVTAVLREIREETGLEAEVVPTAQTFGFAYPGQIQPPYTILLEDSPEPGEAHKHIDLIYFCRPRPGARLDPPAGDSMHWVDEASLRSNQPLELAACGVTIPLSDDVRALAIKAIEVAKASEGAI
ncbi:MAG: NUDIX domain-containing protein [Chloroflexi bacterium]|nr:NUDIX domain-containing protein [Chloroflexota bacterium]